MIKVLSDEAILPNELFQGLQNAKRIKALEEFEILLNQNVSESVWQKWFECNSWILGSEFVQVLEDRRIDTSNIADYLVKAYDGFLDVIEIKRPSSDLPFWSNTKDHDNYIPSQSLVKAISQSQKYIYEVERESNSAKFINRCDGILAVKPRCILIYGRINDWNKSQREALRLLNASYNNLTILTYDQVLLKAKNMLGLIDD